MGSLIAAAALIGGCSGGSQSGTLIAPGTAPVTFSIAWAGRSRAVNPPASAESVVVTVGGAGAGGTDVSTTVNRDLTRTDAYTQSVTLPTTAKFGSWTVKATFYPGLNATGQSVGTAISQIDISSTGSNTGYFASSSKVASVSVDPVALTWEKPTTLTFTVKDATGAILPVSAGSGFFTLISGSSNATLTPSGLVTPTALGSITVSAKVDGISSPATVLTITSPVAVAVTPAAVTLNTGESAAFTASVTGTTNTAVTWSVLEGSAGGAIDANGVYTAPASTRGTFHVLAVSQADKTTTGTAVVTVQSGGATIGVRSVPVSGEKSRGGNK